MRQLPFASTNIHFVKKAVQDAIRRCERIIVVGSSEEYQKIYFFTGRKNYWRYYTIDLNAMDTLVPKRFQQANRTFHDEVLHGEPLAHTVNRAEASKLLDVCSNEELVSAAPVTKPNTALRQWVKTLLVPLA